MKPIAELGNLILWLFVTILVALAIWAGFQPYRVTHLFQNLAALTGPSLSQIVPLEGLLLRIPKQVANCREVGWVKTLVEAKAIAVDGLCNVSVAPALTQHIAKIGNLAAPGFARRHRQVMAAASRSAQRGRCFAPGHQ